MTISMSDSETDPSAAHMPQRDAAGPGPGIRNPVCPIYVTAGGNRPQANIPPPMSDVSPYTRQPMIERETITSLRHMRRRRIDGRVQQRGRPKRRFQAGCRALG